MLEIGSGWTPIIPLLFTLCGAKTVVLTDVEELADATTVRNAIEVIRTHADEISAALGLELKAIESRLAGIGDLTFEAQLHAFGWIYQVPWTQAPLGDGGLDIVYSRAVLEHIRPNEIRHIFLAAHKNLRHNGYMCHIIDNSDHTEHNDKMISRVNFLKYNDIIWSLTGINRQDYQNRLRHSNYLALIAESGYSIVTSQRDVCERSLQALDTLPLAERFCGMARDDLATMTSFIVARRGAAPAPADRPDGLLGLGQAIHAAVLARPLSQPQEGPVLRSE